MLRADAKGRALLDVRLTPKGGRDAIDGVATDADGRAHLKCRVSAPPEDGAANAALERLIAAALGLPRSAVTVVAGATARRKTLRIDAGAEAVAAALAPRG